jgi:predicted GNAT family acetyltransferase
MPVVAGNMRRATVVDRPLLRQWLIEFQQEAMGEVDLNATDRNLDNTLSSPPTVRGLFLWEHNGIPASMSGYAGPTPNGIRIGPVYTPPSHRRHGYAGALVAQLSQQLLDEGRRVCFLFTDLSNPTSNHIYQTIGYQPVCDVDEYKFNVR